MASNQWCGPSKTSTRRSSLTEISIRPFEDRDLDEVLEVLRLALGEPPLLQRTPELFAWKHVHNPFGRSLIWLAEIEGRVAGVRAFMRWQLTTVDGTTVSCVRAVDTATHPDFQRRGVFRALTEHALTSARDEGIQLVFNTPNKRSGPGYLEMGWHRVASLSALVRPSWRLLRPRRHAESSAADLDLTRRGSPPENQSLGDRPARGLRTPRTGDYLRWRFSEHPTARYVALGNESGMAIARPNLRRGRRELMVSDVFGNPNEAFAAIRQASQADYLLTWFSPGPERRAAARHGFIPIPRVGLDLYVNPLTDLEMDVTSLSNWDLATSDLELL